MSKKMKYGIVGICLVIAVGCIGYMWTYYADLNKEEAVYEELRDEVVEEVVKEEVEVEEEIEVEEEVYVPVEIPIDFETLQETNSDIYAWIDIEGTDISYPILQREGDGEYYLRLSVEEEYSTAGCIFTQEVCGLDFSIANTVMYGHNMSNLTMFGTLSYFRDEDYMKEHETITIYTPDAIRTYQVFAATTFTDILLTSGYNFYDQDAFATYLEDMVSYSDMNKYIRDDVEVTEEDRIITLSTCIRNQSGVRLLVSAVLIDEQINRTEE